MFDDDPWRATTSDRPFQATNTSRVHSYPPYPENRNTSVPSAGDAFQQSPDEDVVMDDLAEARRHDKQSRAITHDGDMEKTNRRRGDDPRNLAKTQEIIAQLKAEIAERDAASHRDKKIRQELEERLKKVEAVGAQNLEELRATKLSLAKQMNETISNQQTDLTVQGLQRALAVVNAEKAELALKIQHLQTSPPAPSSSSKIRTGDDIVDERMDDSDSDIERDEVASVVSPKHDVRNKRKGRKFIMAPPFGRPKGGAGRKLYLVSGSNDEAGTLPPDTTSPAVNQHINSTPFTHNHPFNAAVNHTTPAVGTSRQLPPSVNRIPTGRSNTSTSTARPSVATGRRRSPSPDRLNTIQHQPVMEEMEGLKTMMAMLMQNVMTLQQRHMGRSPGQQGPVVFRQPPQRRRDAIRTLKLKEIRHAMNELLGIEQDIHILQVSGATDEEVDDFQHNSGPGPELSDFRVYWNDLDAEWNNELGMLFMRTFLEEHPTLSEDAEELREMYDDRLIRLKRLMIQHSPQEGETEEGYAQRMSRIKSHTLDRQRPHTRRKTLLENRREICQDNIKRQDRSIDPAWERAAWAVNTLGAGGMSSDDSETDEDGPTFRVKIMEWRSPEIVPILDVIDADYNGLNAYGNRRAGNPQRTRTREGGTLSVRPPIKALPLTFYAADWYNSLSSRMQRALKATVPIPLPCLTYTPPPSIHQTTHPPTAGHV
ncbi:uncharacterized protein ARMOST_22233 [Armillaria ostoyae]|uniref:Uncharacterized protein n=1 Tax=Armillaria ostoyae TaxID=47428 RepID=A0A284SCB5_ARMOS|nr:uncharacterized protein ARMOST_22233 [Armillaria ostoyae]